MSLEKIKLSSNYDTIVNFLYEENDDLSSFLVDNYQKYIFSIKNKKSISNIDKTMNEYVKKEKFYKFVKENFKEEDKYDTYDKIVLKLNKLYKIYEEDVLKKFKSTRWL